MNNLIISGFSDEINKDFDTQLRVASELGVKAIEIRGVNGRSIQTYSVEEAKELKAKLDAKGMHVSSIGSAIGKIQITDDFEAHFEVFKHVVELCKVFGTKYIRMFSFFVPEGKADEYEAEVISRLEKLIAYAKEQDVILLHDMTDSSVKAALSIMDKLQAQGFRFVTVSELASTRGITPEPGRQYAYFR